MGILSHPASYVGRNVDCGVSKLNGMKLWQTFVENIDAFVKVLHVPTAEIAIFTAINQPHMVKKDTIALLHAVYYAAVTSLDPDEVLRMLGMDRGTALTKFKVEFQKAVAEADILENPTVTLLQGLAIYLVSLPRTCIRSDIGLMRILSSAYCNCMEPLEGSLDPERLGFAHRPVHWLTHRRQQARTVGL